MDQAVKINIESEQALNYQNNYIDRNGVTQQERKDKQNKKWFKRNFYTQINFASWFKNATVLV